MNKLKVSERKAKAHKFVEREIHKYVCHYGTWNTARIMEIAIRKLKGEINAIKQREREERDRERKPRKRKRVRRVAKVPRPDVSNDVGTTDSRHGVKDGADLSRECPP